MIYLKDESKQASFVVKTNRVEFEEQENWKDLFRHKLRKAKRHIANNRPDYDICTNVVMESDATGDMTYKMEFTSLDNIQLFRED